MGLKGSKLMSPNQNPKPHNWLQKFTTNVQIGYKPRKTCVFRSPKIYTRSFEIETRRPAVWGDSMPGMYCLVSDLVFFFSSPHLKRFSKLTDQGKFFVSWWFYPYIADLVRGFPSQPCLSLRVENRPSVLGIFIYVPWGGVGWGGAITFTYLRTPMMLRHGTFTCTCAHTSCYVEDVSRHAGVG